MHSFKAVCFNNISYCRFPKGTCNIKDFIAFLNENYNSFIELEVFVEDGCIAPFFIEENATTDVQYWNSAHIRLAKECEVYFLSKSEYDERLKSTVEEKCTRCIHYSEDTCEQDHESHREHISLNGECYGFEKKE